MKMTPLVEAARSVYTALIAIYVAPITIRNGSVAFYQDPKRKQVMRRLRQIKRERRTQLELHELFNIFSAVEATAKVPGDTAEVGVYRGGSAKVIAEFNGGRHLHLCDTFEGLPDLSQHDSKEQFYAGQYAVSLESVQAYLSKDANLSFHKGLFPASANEMANKQFSFVNLDVDLYESTRASLEFFYPRLAKGAILTSHDYSTCGGVKRAFDEFFAMKPEPVIALCGSQCLVVKM
jgi:O-methyltransferase